MNIWIINAQENPPAPRTSTNRKLWRSNCLAEYLADNGHKVYRIRSDFSHQAKKHFYRENIVVKTDNYFHVYLKSVSYVRHFGFRRILNHLSLGCSFWKISFKLKKPDVVHLCNVPLELSIAVVIYCKLHSIPCVLDVRDLWPDAYLRFADQYDLPLRTILRYFIKLSFYFLNYSYRNATCLTSISPLILKWSLEKANRQPRDSDTWFPIFNHAPSKGDFPPTNVIRDFYNIPYDHHIAIYSGNIGYQTDFDSILTLAKLCSMRNIKLTFVLAGSGPLLARLQEKSSLINNVRFTDWLNGDDLSQILSISTFGILAFYPTLDYSLSFPNKFVEYLANSLIPLTHVKGLMSDFMVQNSLGISLDHFSDSSSLDLIQEMLSSETIINAQKEKSLSVFKTNFDIDSVLPLMANHLLTTASIN